MATIENDSPKSAHDTVAACGDSLVDSSAKPNANHGKATPYAGARSFDDVFSLDHMISAGRKCCNGVRWKTSTINFENDRLHRCYLARKSLKEGTRKFKHFHTFCTIEHGKCRQINALGIDDRMMQKCLVQYSMRDIIVPSLTTDNCASLPGRGMDYAVKRLKHHLHDHYRKYGLDGGIYMFDFHSYFASILHDRTKTLLREPIADDDVYNVLCSFIDDFNKIPDSKNGVGVGLGSEISQPIALYYMSSCLDHCIKDKCGIKGFGRYNDDGYVISNSFSELERIKRDTEKIAASCGIQMNPKKNIIIPFRNHSFCFLKLRFQMKENGKIIVKLSHKNAIAHKRKLKLLKQKYDAGMITFDDIKKSHDSWKAYAKKYNAYETIRSMDRYFYALFQAEGGMNVSNFHQRYPQRHHGKSTVYQKS